MQYSTRKKIGMRLSLKMKSGKCKTVIQTTYSTFSFWENRRTQLAFNAKWWIHLSWTWRASQRFIIAFSIIIFSSWKREKKKVFTKFEICKFPKWSNKSADTFSTNDNLTLRKDWKTRAKNDQLRQFNFNSISKIQFIFNSLIKLPFLLSSPFCKVTSLTELKVHLLSAF